MDFFFYQISLGNDSLGKGTLDTDFLRAKKLKENSQKIQSLGDLCQRGQKVQRVGDHSRRRQKVQHVGDP